MENVCFLPFISACFLIRINIVLSSVVLDCCLWKKAICHCEKTLAPDQSGGGLEAAWWHVLPPLLFGFPSPDIRAMFGLWPLSQRQKLFTQSAVTAALWMYQQSIPSGLTQQSIALMFKVSLKWLERNSREWSLLKAFRRAATHQTHKQRAGFRENPQSPPTAAVI